MNENPNTISLKKIIEPQIFHVNSFVADGCKGNPAGICLLPGEKDERFYQDTAVKIGLSETVFLFDQDGIYLLKWFTRGAIEVALCGHATLAAAWILWNKGYVGHRTAIHFNTKSGILSAALDEDNVTLDFPLKTVAPLEKDEYGLAEILGLKILYLGKSQFDLFAVTESEEDITRLDPDFQKLAKIPARGISISAKAHRKKYDFVSRFFAPSIGIDEDPVTGSAHCALASYWRHVLKKNTMTGYQASREGGIVGMEVNKQRVLLSGKAQEVYF